jgi:hypothetical protein
MVLVTKKRPTRAKTPNKRTTGHHHNRDGHYLKTYWPYLPLLLIVGMGLVFSSFWGQAQKGVLGYATDLSITALLQETNNQRTSNGLGTLTLHDKLNAAAQAKANDMAARDYWAHNTPDGATPWTFFDAAGYNYKSAGENLAYGFDSSAATVTAWMNSPEHRANILNNTYVDVGFGVANNPNYQGTGPETIVVAEYGSQQPGAVPAPAATKPAATTMPTPTEQTPITNTSPVAVSETPAETPKETNTAPVAGAAAKADNKVVATKNVSRIELLTKGNAPWSMFAVSAIATVSIAVFFLRHGLLWHRVLVRSEVFVHRHHFLDIALVATAVIGFILSRSAGVIH